MNKLSILKTELALPAYSAMTDEQCLTALTTQDIPVKQSISSHDIRQYLAVNNKFMALENSVASIAKMTSRYMDVFPSFDMTDSSVETTVTNALTALVAEGLITTDDKTAILAMGTKMISRAEELGISVNLGEVNWARN